MAEGSLLEARIQAIEDRLDIYNLIASHPPSADTGASDYTASVWMEDGEFDRGSQFPAPKGRAAIAATSSSLSIVAPSSKGLLTSPGCPMSG